eukprot:XP_014774383.1 PREDICTED: meiotic recombination protein SPO11-like [Octopus bimaculoides]
MLILQMEGHRFSVEFGLETIMEPKTSKISFGLKRSRKKFDLLLKLLAIIYQLVQTDAYRTKRDIYYQNVNCFKTQSVLDTLLNNISHLLEVPRWDLHVLSTSKGCIAGDLQFHDANGNFICCKNTKSGIMLPSNVMEINNIYTHALFILVVEKDATFQHLLNYGISDQFPYIIITGKGFPDINTRLLLKTLWNELRIPVFGLMDADAHGRYLDQREHNKKDINVELNKISIFPLEGYANHAFKVSAHGISLGLKWHINDIFIVIVTLDKKQSSPLDVLSDDYITQEHSHFVLNMTLLLE